MNEVLNIEDVQVSYGNRSVLEGLSLVVKEGETVAILGQNGAGKSTLLKSIMGLVGITRGEIYFEGKSITNIPVYKKRSIGIGYFPQDREIFDELTVAENLGIAGKDLISGEFTDKIKYIKTIMPFIEKIEKNKKGYVLSGGERRFLGLAMAFLGDIKLLLLDEPSAGLSPTNVDSIYKYLREIKKMGLTMILIEQRIKEAVGFADRVCLLKDGKIEKEERNKDWKKIEKMFFG